MKLRSRIALGIAIFIFCAVALAFKASAERTRLHDAVEEGNIEKAAALCEEHPEWLSEEDDAYGVPLMYAETPEMIDCLVKRGAKLESIRLGWVIVIGRAELAKYMVKNGADVDHGLCVATSVGDEDLIKYMVENGASVTKALPAASVTGRVDVIKYFIENGADINAKDEQGNTLLNAMVNFCKSYESDSNFDNCRKNVEKAIDYLRSIGAEE